MARRAGRTFSRGPRRASDWSASALQVVTLAVPAQSAVLIESFTPVVGGETVIRTRGSFGIQSDQVAATENQFGAFGIAVVTAQALSVGITAIPHPGTDAAWGGWFVHRYFSQTFLLSSAVGTESNFMQQYEIDSKAMRKVDEDERLVVVCENFHATAGLAVWFMARFLSKLH